MDKSEEIFGLSKVPEEVLLRKEVKELRLQRGKDSAYISELEDLLETERKIRGKIQEVDYKIPLERREEIKEKLYEDQVILDLKISKHKNSLKLREQEKTIKRQRDEIVALNMRIQEKKE